MSPQPRDHSLPGLNQALRTRFADSRSPHHRVHQGVFGGLLPPDDVNLKRLNRAIARVVAWHLVNGVALDGHENADSRVLSWPRNLATRETEDDRSLRVSIAGEVVVLQKVLGVKLGTGLPGELARAAAQSQGAAHRVGGSGSEGRGIGREI